MGNPPLRCASPFVRVVNGGARKVDHNVLVRASASLPLAIPPVRSYAANWPGEASLSPRRARRQKVDHTPPRKNCTARGAFFFARRYTPRNGNPELPHRIGGRVQVVRSTQARFVNCLVRGQVL